MTMHLGRSVTRAGVLLGVTLAVGCGAGTPTAFPGEGAGTSTADGGDAAPNPGPTTDSGPVDLFTSSDAAPPAVTFDCKPGTYAGTFKTHISSDRTPEASSRSTL